MPSLAQVSLQLVFCIDFISGRRKSFKTGVFCNERFALLICWRRGCINWSWLGVVYDSINSHGYVSVGTLRDFRSRLYLPVFMYAIPSRLIEKPSRCDIVAAFVYN